MAVNETLAKLDSGKYINNREIVLGGIPFTAREVLIKAPLMSGINAYLVGGTGEGKTELANDLMSFFGSHGCYTMGRPDFEPAELMRHVRLDRLKDAKTDKELVELTENVDKALFYVDELNRCPPIVQNYFFDFFDGKLVHQGKIRNLGKDGYTLGFATGNLGNGEYVGVADSDRALLDRMHMIVKLDHPDFATTEMDDLDIFSSKKNPRASLPEGDGIYNEILAMHRDFRESEVPLILPVLGVYLTKGLDYVEGTPTHSKRALGPRWYSAEGVRRDTDESKIHPLSKRAIFGAISLSSALERIAKEKGIEDTKIDRVDLFLDCLRLTVPYSGVIVPSFIDIEHGGDVYTAFDSLLGQSSIIRGEITGRKEDLEEACAYAEAGDKNDGLLSRISAGEDRWTSVKNAISMYADRREQNPSEKGIKIKGILAEATK